MPTWNENPLIQLTWTKHKIAVCVNVGWAFSSFNILCTSFKRAEARVVSKPLQKFQGSSAKTQNKIRAMVATEKVHTRNLIAPAQLNHFFRFLFSREKKSRLFSWDNFLIANGAEILCVSSEYYSVCLPNLFSQTLWFVYCVSIKCLKFSSLMHHQNVLCLLIVMYEFYGLIAQFWWLRWFQ